MQSKISFCLNMTIVDIGSSHNKVIIPKLGGRTVRISQQFIAVVGSNSPPVSLQYLGAFSEYIVYITIYNLGHCNVIQKMWIKGFTCDLIGMNIFIIRRSNL